MVDLRETRNFVITKEKTLQQFTVCGHYNFLIQSENVRSNDVLYVCQRYAHYILFETKTKSHLNSSFTYRPAVDEYYFCFCFSIGQYYNAEEGSGANKNTENRLN